VRLSVVLLVLAALGVIGGAALISVPAIGAAVIFDSLCVGFWAVQRDDGTAPVVERLPGQQTLAEVIERARAS
jgi:hypothetical protein